MILRYLLFATMIIVSIIIVMTLVKDTGETRKKLEKRLKLDNSSINKTKISSEAALTSSASIRPKPKSSTQNKRKRQE